MTCRWRRGYALWSRRVGLSPWSCRRCVFGEARGSGMEDTSWVCSLYQCGSSSSRAVSSSIRIYQRKKRPRSKMHSLQMVANKHSQWLIYSNTHLCHNTHRALTVSTIPHNPFTLYLLWQFYTVNKNIKAHCPCWTRTGPPNLVRALLRLDPIQED